MLKKKRINVLNKFLHFFFIDKEIFFSRIFLISDNILERCENIKYDYEVNNIIFLNNIDILDYDIFRIEENIIRFFNNFILFNF